MHLLLSLLLTLLLLPAPRAQEGAGSAEALVLELMDVPEHSHRQELLQRRISESEDRAEQERLMTALAVVQELDRFDVYRPEVIETYLTEALSPDAARRARALEAARSGAELDDAGQLRIAVPEELALFEPPRLPRDHPRYAALSDYEDRRLVLSEAWIRVTLHSHQRCEGPFKTYVYQDFDPLLGQMRDYKAWVEGTWAVFQGQDSLDNKELRRVLGRSKALRGARADLHTRTEPEALEEAIAQHNAALQAELGLSDDDLATLPEFLAPPPDLPQGARLLPPQEP